MLLGIEALAIGACLCVYADCMGMQFCACVDHIEEHFILFAR